MNQVNRLTVMGGASSAGLWHSQIVRLYVILLLLGFVIMSIATLAQAFNIAPPTTTVIPDPSDADSYIRIKTPYPQGSTQMLGLAAGLAINVYSIQRYMSKTHDIRHKRSIQNKRLIAIGVTATIIVVSLDIAKLLIIL